MTQSKLHTTVDSKINQSKQTGYYYLKNGGCPKNNTNSILLELKICKV